MSFREPRARPPAKPQPGPRAVGRRILALGSVLAVAVTTIAIVLGSVKKSPDHATRSASSGSASHAKQPASSRHATPATAARAPIPILMYHVINVAPAGAPSPALYVPGPEFSAQMQALKQAGWHAVTLNQVEAYWTHGTPLGPGKPIVLSFDDGYHSQYANALPVLKQLGWVGVENLQVSGLPPSEGGLSDTEVRGLLAAGWELDTEGISHADLITLDSAQLQYQVASARQLLRQRYGVPVNWFCYPSGHYDATVIAAVRAAGYVGSTTVVPGWATPTADRFRLPRLRVIAGTTPTQLLAQIAAAQNSPAPPSTYSAAGLA